MRTLLDLFDDRLTRAIMRLPDWMRPLMVFATFIGGPVFTFGIGLLLTGIGYGEEDGRLFQAGVIVVLTVLLGGALKLLLRRNRPLTYVAKWPFKTFSFPSGHTVGGVVAFGTLAYLTLRLEDAVSYILAVIFVLIMVAIGMSRVYLGAHYPSDVAAGWLLGGAGLAVIAVMIQPAL